MYIKKCQLDIMKKNKKEAHERYQNLSEEKKNKKCQYARERYQNLSEEKKEKKRQYYREHHKNLPEDKKQMTAEYRRNNSIYIENKDQGSLLSEINI